MALILFDTNIFIDMLGGLDLVDHQVDDLALLRVQRARHKIHSWQRRTQVIGTHSGIGLVTKNRYDIAPMNAIPAPASSAGTNDQVCAM